MPSTGILSTVAKYTRMPLTLRNVPHMIYSKALPACRALLFLLHESVCTQYLQRLWHVLCGDSKSPVRLCRAFICIVCDLVTMGHQLHNNGVGHTTASLQQKRGMGSAVDTPGCTVMS